MNYIQPNINMNTNDFGFSKPSTQTQDKSFADLSFADALKAAYKNDRFASERNERKEESAPSKSAASCSSERNEKVKDEPAEKSEKTDGKMIQKSMKARATIKRWPMQNQRTTKATMPRKIPAKLILPILK